MRIIFFRIVCLLLFLPLAPVYAQLTEYKHLVKYTMQNGLSSYNIRKIIKCKNGYLWVATQYGLSRFDGKSFVNYSKSASPLQQLCGVDIREVVEDTARHILWTLPGEYGCNGIDQKTSSVTCNRQIGYRSAEEFGMAMALLHNKLWLGSSTTLRIFDIAGNKFCPDAEAPSGTTNSHNLEAHLLYTDARGNLWCFYSWYGIVIYDGRTNKKIREYPASLLHDAAGLGNVIVNGCIPIGSHRLLVATSQGMRAISFSANYDIQVEPSPCKALPALNAEPVEAIGATVGGTLLVASHSQLLRLDSALTSYTILKENNGGSEGDWLSSVQCIYTDDDGNTWLGCQQGLAFVAGGRSPFLPVYFDKATNNTLDHVRSIHVLGNGDILAGLRNGLAHIDHATGQFSIIDKGHLYNHLYQDRNGRIHASTRQGMFIYDHGQVRPVASCYPELKPYCGSPVNSHLFIGDSLVVLGTENEKGILLWNTSTHTVRQIDNSSPVPLASSVVNNMYRDGAGRIWVLSDHVISIVEPGFQRITPLAITDTVAGKKVNLFFDMCELNGSYWIAAYGTGIIQLDTALHVKKILNTRSGLSDNGVYQVFPVKDHILITSDNGLSLLSLPLLTFKRYYSEDGLHSNSFEEVAGAMYHGLIYAGGVKGFTIIDPARFATNAMPPRVYINRIFVDRANKQADIDTTDLELQELRIPNDVLQVTLHFSGINYSNPGRTTFAYRIREKNDDWVNIGTQNYINIIGLSHGAYHVEVKAANEDGVWSAPVMLSLVYLPKWHEAWWFKALVLAAALAAAYGAYRIRLYQVLKQQEIRRHVASDLHDDIGSSLNSVKVFAHLAKAHPAHQPYITSIEDHLEQATIGLRDMIWILDDKRDTIADLCHRLSQYSAPPAEAMGVHVHFSIQDGAGNISLSKPVKRNLFLIAKECINNSIKYAQCRHIRLSIQQQSRKLQLVISDDGRGFDTTTTTDGYGLANIRIRATQAGYDCTITSGPEGTRVSLSEQ